MNDWRGLIDDAGHLGFALERVLSHLEIVEYDKGVWGGLRKGGARCECDQFGITSIEDNIGDAPKINRARVAHERTHKRSVDIVVDSFGLVEHSGVRGGDGSEGKSGVRSVLHVQLYVECFKRARLLIERRIGLCGIEQTRIASVFDAEGARAILAEPTHENIVDAIGAVESGLHHAWIECGHVRGAHTFFIAAQVGKEAELARYRVDVVLDDLYRAGKQHRRIGQHAKSLRARIVLTRGACGYVGTRELHRLYVGAHVEEHNRSGGEIARVKPERVDAHIADAQRVHTYLGTILLAWQAGIGGWKIGGTGQRPRVVQGQRVRVGVVGGERGTRLSVEQPQTDQIAVCHDRRELVVGVETRQHIDVRLDDAGGAG